MQASTSAASCRFPLIDPATATDPTVRATYGEIERELGFGMVPNIFRSLGSQPLVLEGTWRLFRAVVLHGTLPRIVKELIGTAVSSANRSPYALAVHMHSLGVQGVDKHIMAMVAEDRLDDIDLAPSVVALLRIASQSARLGPATITDADLHDLREQDLTMEEIQEAFAAINLFQYVNSLTDLARVPVDAL
ncbi:MAG: carboxymuconolactone decarboxylase family protein [Ktedonobacterales bacterium]|nr:carboxymuconolactone decarboxylase family protein [Ktedonobacterales bacterium]